ncbi:threonine/serine dehydratase [Vulcanisaeta distributa]|uniref:threonine ammonia-lyase n=1 Tax=Vulcanisaeta distributa TaxID=164451 RepID=UPI000B090996|nr:threonine/serine dehydratase [Vulcanisaeta distributa]
MFSLLDVYRAKQVISRYLPRTPLVYSRQLSRLLGFDVYLKLENLQPTRAFKVRGGGVYFAMVKRDEAQRRGLIAASTGNHAQSVVYAGKLIGARVVIVMPEGVSRVKVEALKDLGAEIIFHGKVFDEALDYAMSLTNREGLLFVHSTNEPLLYPGGVGTMHLEVVEDLPDVDVVINPIGGGSGASSAVIVYKSVNPSIKVIGVQAEGAPSVYLSLREGRLISTGYARTIAEGLATARAYELPFSILRGGRIDDVVLVSDDEMLRAIKELALNAGQVAGPAGAAALAAAMKLRSQLMCKKVVIMVTGGNIDPELFMKALENY